MKFLWIILIVGVVLTLRVALYRRRRRHRDSVKEDDTTEAPLPQRESHTLTQPRQGRGNLCPVRSPHAVRAQSPSDGPRLFFKHLCQIFF